MLNSGKPGLSFYRIMSLNLTIMQLPSLSHRAEHDVMTHYKTSHTGIDLLNRTKIIIMKNVFVLIILLTLHDSLSQFLSIVSE